MNNNFNLNITGENAAEMNKAVASALISKGILFADKPAKEVFVEDIANFIGLPKENSRYFVASGLLIEVAAEQKEVRPYQRYESIWSDFLDEYNISEHNLPFTVFVVYYLQYENWLKGELCIDEDDTDFYSYITEIICMDVENLPTQTNVTLDVANIEIVTVYSGRVIADIKDLLNQTMAQKRSLTMLLETADQKLAAFDTNINNLNALLS